MARPELRHLFENPSERHATAQSVVNRWRTNVTGKPGVWIPTKQEMQSYKPTRAMYASEKMLRGIHNIHHLSDVQPNLILLTTQLQANNPKFFTSLGEKFTQKRALNVLLRMAMVHDTQRHFDDIESFNRFALQFHERGAASLLKKTPEQVTRLRRLHLAKRADRIEAVQQALNGLDEYGKDLVIAGVRHHDSELLVAEADLRNNPKFKNDEQKIQQALLLLEIFKAADNLEVVRVEAACLFDQRRSNENRCGGERLRNQLRNGSARALGCKPDIGAWAGEVQSRHQFIA